MNKFRSLLVRHSATVVLAIACTFVTIAMPVSAYAQLSPAAAGIGGLAVGGIAGYAIGSGALGNGQSLAGTAAGAAAGITSAGQQAANAMCNPVIPTCGCGMVVNPQGGCMAGTNMHACVCGQSTNGFPVTGICDLPNHCQAMSAGSLGGGSAGVGAGSLGSLLQAVGGLLGSLMSSQGSSAGGDSGAGISTGIGGGCIGSFYAESTTPTPTDPCAYYVAPTTPITTPVITCDALSQSLGLCGASTTPIIGPNPLPTTPTSTGTGLNGDLTSTASVTGTFGGQPVATATPAGLSGSIQTTGTGATFVTNDVEGNTETSSFFGGDTLGGFVNNLISNWCRNRPWATGFIVSIIPPTFFDGLCSANGFTVGTPTPTTSVNNAPAQSQTVLTQTPVQQHVPQVVQVIASSTPFIQPRVDIWAVPPSVPLGSRTTIFWNTENVTDCSETSPDGSFSQSSLSGGAATVPLTEATSFSISCLDSQGNPATDYITVNIGG